MTETQINDLLKQVSRKDTLIKCEPFNFRLGWQGKFKEFPWNTNSPDKFFTVSSDIYTYAGKLTEEEGKPNRTHFTKGTLEMLNNPETQSQFSNKFLPQIADIPINKNFMPVDLNKSSLNINFFLDNYFHFDATYELVSLKFKCVSISNEEGVRVLFYIHGNEIKRQSLATHVKIYFEQN